MFGIGRKAQGSGGSKLGFAEVWDIFNILAELCSNFLVLFVSLMFDIWVHCTTTFDLLK